MSINFFCPDAPTTLVALDDDNPAELSEESTLPSVNLSQDNAKAFLRLLHLPVASEGVIAAADIPNVTQHLLRVANSEKRRSLEHVPRSDSRGPGPRIIAVGVKDEYFQRMATKLLDLFAKARANNYSVVWA